MLLGTLLVIWVEQLATTEYQETKVTGALVLTVNQ